MTSCGFAHPAGAVHRLGQHGGGAGAVGADAGSRADRAGR